MSRAFESIRRSIGAGRRTSKAVTLRRPIWRVQRGSRQIDLVPSRGKPRNGGLQMTDTSNQDIEKIIQALHTILYFRSNYPSTAEAQRIIQETLQVLKGDGRSLLCTNVSIAIGASLSNKEVQVSPRDF
jgi:hypothetical protein